EIYRNALGDNNPAVAQARTDLATLLWKGEHKPAEAQAILRDSLAVYEKAFGSDHPDPDWATTLNNMALILFEDHKLAEAEPYQRQALAMRRKLFGNEHLDVALSLEKLAELLNAEGKPDEAEPLARECLAIRHAKIPDEWQAADASAMLGAYLLAQKK